MRAIPESESKRHQRRAVRSAWAMLVAPLRQALPRCSSEVFALGLVLHHNLTGLNHVNTATATGISPVRTVPKNCVYPFTVNREHAQELGPR